MQASIRATTLEWLQKFVASMRAAARAAPTLHGPTRPASRGGSSRRSTGSTRRPTCHPSSCSARQDGRRALCSPPPLRCPAGVFGLPRRELHPDDLRQRRTRHGRALRFFASVRFPAPCTPLAHTAAPRLLRLALTLARRSSGRPLPRTRLPPHHHQSPAHCMHRPNPARRARQPSADRPRALLAAGLLPLLSSAESGPPRGATIDADGGSGALPAPEAGPAHATDTLSHARASSHLTATTLLTPPLSSLASLAQALGGRGGAGQPPRAPLPSRPRGPQPTILGVADACVAREWCMHVLACLRTHVRTCERVQRDAHVCVVSAPIVRAVSRARSS